MTRPFGEMIVEEVGRLLPTTEEMLAHGCTADDGCALFYGARVAVQRITLESGLEVPADVTAQVSGGNLVLAPGDANNLYRQLMRGSKDERVLRPQIAAVIGAFDDRDRLRTLDALYLLFEGFDPFEEYRPSRLPKHAVTPVSGSMARLGDVQWHIRSSGLLANRVFGNSEMTRIERRRDEIVRSRNAKQLVS